MPRSARMRTSINPSQLPVHALQATSVVQVVLEIASELFLTLSDDLIFKAVSSPTSQAHTTVISTPILLGRQRKSTFNLIKSVVYFFQYGCQASLVA